MAQSENEERKRQRRGFRGWRLRRKRKDVPVEESDERTGPESPQLRLPQQYALSNQRNLSRIPTSEVVVPGSPGTMSNITEPTNLKRPNHKPPLLFPDFSNHSHEDMVFEDNGTTQTSASPMPKHPITKWNGQHATVNETAHRVGSWISRSSYFRKLSGWAFDVVDADGSGSVDEKELYSGLLLIHLKLGSYAGPAACKPVDRERVRQIFEKYDVDKSGSLDREEFHQVMIVLCGNVFTRVFVQWGLTLLIVPMLAQWILDTTVDLFAYLGSRLAMLDDYESLTEHAESLYHFLVHENLAPLLVRLWQDHVVPHPRVATTAQQIYDAIMDIPEAVWETVPVTLISCILGCIVVPYCIYKIDEFYDWVADVRKKKKPTPRQ